MNNRIDYSDEHLNAYIDGELDKQETGQLIDELRHNPELSRRITELQKVREMVRYAYQDIDQHAAEQSSKPKLQRRPWKALAAGVLLAVGFGLGWGVHMQTGTGGGLLDMARAIQVKPPTADTGSTNLVLHVTTGEKRKLQTVLEEAEKLLAEYSRTNRPVKMDILTNGQGLKLLHAKHSPFAERIEKLQQQYQNLTFKACAKAIKKVMKETGQEVPMLPNTVIVPSAIGEVMQRQQDGWSYVRI